MGIDEVVGQREAWQRLMLMQQEDRIPHALMFCGPQGSGKMALALAFASHLLGDSPMLKEWAHPDLHFTFPTIKQSNMGSEHQPVSDDFINEWRALLKKGPYFSFEQWMTAMGAANQQAVITGAESDAVAKELSLKASQGGYKICLVWLPERMNLTSANKILKILEEPPQHTLFLMVSEEPERLLETIRSRAQRFVLRRIGTDDIYQALVSKCGIDEEMAHSVSRMADGSWAKALATIDAGNEDALFFDLFTMFMRMAYARQVKELKKWSEAAAAFGREKQKRMLIYFMRMVRESFMFNFQQPDLCYMTPAEQKFVVKFARFINEANVIEINDIFGRALRDIGQNANSKIVLYDVALKMIVALIKKP